MKFERLSKRGKRRRQVRFLVEMSKKQARSNNQLRADLESAEMKADHYNEEIVASHGDRDEARARLAAVEKWHQPLPYYDVPTKYYCKECGPNHSLYPCRTVKAVRGE